MRCPACGVAMAQRSFGPVDVDVCPCGGLFFDWAELGKVDEPHEGFGAALEAALARNARKRRTAPLRCTKCNTAMREHRYENVPGVWIDECYGCRGFFLDAGELCAIRNVLGDREQQKRAVESLLASDPLYCAERLEMDAEEARARALETVSRALTSPPKPLPYWVIRRLWRILGEIILRSRV
jgi:Zn-finger nucleic acid-binding protein